MIRYISWAIPSIGFIGTVRGIGEALAQADKAVQGDIAGVTQSLGVAFNSTFIALLISIFLMFLVHQLQLGLAPALAHQHGAAVGEGLEHRRRLVARRAADLERLAVQLDVPAVRRDEACQHLHQGRLSDIGAAGDDHVTTAHWLAAHACASSISIIRCAAACSARRRLLP